MKISDIVSMCVRNLIRRKFRTFLTVLGVVIGTTLIILMISLGIGISLQQEEQLKMWGDLSMIEVWYGGGSSASGETLTLDDEAVRQMQVIDGVDIATPFVNLQINVELSILGGKNYRYRVRWPNIYGVYPEALEKLGYVIKEGEALPTGKTKVLPVVFGGSMAYQFEDTKKKYDNYRSDWPDENGVIQDPFFPPLDADYKLILPASESSDGTAGKRMEYEFEVVGVLQGERNKWETMYSMFMPLDEMQRIQAEYDKENGIKTSKKEKISYNQVKVKALNISKVPDIEKEIQAMGFGTWSMESQRQEMQKSMLTIQIILGIIGGVTLLVSAISITNTMIMSVYERTREIGVMKVLGCLVGNIRTLFLFEAGFIGFFGGVVGILLSYLLSFLFNLFGGAVSGSIGGMIGYYGSQGGNISVVPPWLAMTGLAFATVIGLVSGFYPANRAVRISALEAIKQE